MIQANDELPSGLANPTIHITTHNPQAQATIHTSVQNKWDWFDGRDVGFNVVYTTSQFPPDLNDEADITAHKETMQTHKLGLVRPGGTVCRIVDFGPGNSPLMHRTQSLDFGIVLEGEIEMELDDGSVTKMKKGDIAVQRGTMHAWRNTSTTEWARMIFVLQDCKPVIVGGSRLKEDLSTSTGQIPASDHDD